MQNEPRWLTPAEVIEITQDIVSETGEPFLVRDQALLEGACQRPLNLLAYEGVDDAIILGVRLLFAIAQNHPFEQGNKRTAFAAMVIFLRLNGYRVTYPDGRIFAEKIVEVIEGAATETAFEQAIHPYVLPPGS